MKCKNCGNHEIEEAKFCGKCGAPFLADHDAGNGKGPKNNEWAMRDYVYGWLSDGAGLIFGAFQLDESRNEEEKVTTFSVKLSGTPSQFTEEGEVWETIEVDDSPGEKIIQKKTVDDGRKLIFYVEVAESKDELLGHGQVVCFAYFAIPIDYSLYEPACVIAGKWNEGNLSCIQCFRDDESVVVRAKSFALLGEQQKDTLLDVLANDCLKVGYESWRDFEELSESSLGVDDDLIEFGKNEDSDLFDIENLDKVVLEMTSQGANKAALAQYIYESMPNNSRAEVIDQFIKLAKLTPAGASTYYSNIKKEK